MISLVEADKRGPNGLKDEFYGFKKSRKRSTFFYSYSKDTVHLQLLKGYKVINKVCERGTIFQ